MAVYREKKVVYILPLGEYLRTHKALKKKKKKKNSPCHNVVWCWISLGEAVQMDIRSTFSRGVLKILQELSSAI